MIERTTLHVQKVVADHDHIAVTNLALKAYEHALEPKRLVMLKGGRSIQDRVARGH